VKTVSVSNLQRLVGACVDDAQSEGVVVTRRGRPAAVLVGVEGYDWEDLVYMTSPRFWEGVERWRREPLVADDDLPAGW
jgi:prevent-host-death family protein